MTDESICPLPHQHVLFANLHLQTPKPAESSNRRQSHEHRCPVNQRRRDAEPRNHVPTDQQKFRQRARPNHTVSRRQRIKRPTHLFVAGNSGFANKGDKEAFGQEYAEYNYHPPVGCWRCHFFTPRIKKSSRNAPCGFTVADNPAASISFATPCGETKSTPP